MDTQMDVEARRAAALERSREILEQAAAVLAEPRDPEMVARAEEWQRESARHRAEEQEEERHKAEAQAKEAEWLASRAAARNARQNVASPPASKQPSRVYLTRVMGASARPAKPKAAGDGRA